MKKFFIFFGLLIIIYSVYSQDQNNWRNKSKKFRLESISKDILYADYNQLKSLAMSLGLKEEDNSEAYRNALAEYYGIQLLEKKSIESVDKIVLKRAGELKIYQVKEEDEENMHFLGRVKLEIEMKDKENKTITRILEADEIFINTKSKEITGIGNVYFKDDRLEYEGNQFYYNYDVSRGVLFEGRTKLLKGGESGLEGAYFKGKKVVQTGKDEIILYDGMLTTCEEPDPHYFMKVSRLWVSEKGEWGILNGAIFVGKTPLFYFPFYYHPKDLIIQPAFGFRSREGWYLNTTYYIFGEKEADDEKKLVTANDFIEKMRRKPTSPFHITLTMVNQKLNEFYNKHEFYKKYPEFKLYPKFQSIDIAFKAFTDAYTNLGFYSGIYFYINVDYPDFPFTISLVSDLALSRKVWEDNDSDLYVPYKPEDKDEYNPNNTYYSFSANPLVYRMSQWFRMRGEILKSYINFKYDFQLEYATDRSYFTDFYKRKLGFTYIDLLADTISYSIKSSGQELSAFKTREELDATSDANHEKLFTFYSNNFSLNKYPEIFGLKVLEKLNLNIESIITLKDTDVSSAFFENDGSEDPRKNRYLLYKFMAPNMYSASEGDLESKEFRIEGTLLDYDVLLEMPQRINVYQNTKRLEKYKEIGEKEKDKEEKSLYTYIQNIHDRDLTSDKTELDYMLLLPLFSKKTPISKITKFDEDYKYMDVLFDKKDFTYKKEELTDDIEKVSEKDYSTLINVGSYNKRTYIEIKPVGFDMKYALVEKLKNEFVFDTTTDNPYLDTAQSLLTSDEEDRITLYDILKMYNINNNVNYTLLSTVNFLKNQYGPLWGTKPKFSVSYVKHYSSMDVYWRYLNKEDTQEDIDATIFDEESENRRKTEFSIKYNDQLINDLSFGVYRIKGTSIETDLSTDIFTFNELKRYNFMELNYQNRNDLNYQDVDPYYYHNRMSYEKIKKLESRFRAGVYLLPEGNAHVLSMRAGPTISWIIPSTELSMLKSELWDEERDDILYENSNINEAKDYIYYRTGEPNLNDKISDFFWGNDFWGGAKYYRKMFKDITYEIDYSYTNKLIKVVSISNDLIFKFDNIGNFSNKNGELEGFSIYPDEIFEINLFDSIFKYKTEILFKKIKNTVGFSSFTAYQEKIDECKIMTLDNNHSMSCRVPGQLFPVKLPEGDWLKFTTDFIFKWDRTEEWADNSKYNDFYLDSHKISFNVLMDIFQIGLTFKKYNFYNTGYGFELDEGVIELGHRITEIPVFGRFFKLILEPRIGYQFFVKHNDYYEDGILKQYNVDYYEKNKLVFLLNVDLIIGQGTSFETLLHFGVKSENRKMYNYYKEDGLAEFFNDIYDSFNFQDIEKRRKSPFNLQEINVKLEHLLCDWKLTFEYIGKAEKEFKDGEETGRYEWNNRFEFYVTWAVKQKNQLMGLLNKTKLEHKYEKDEWQQPVISLDPNE